MSLEISYGAKRIMTLLTSAEALPHQRCTKSSDLLQSPWLAEGYGESKKFHTKVYDYFVLIFHVYLQKII